MKKSKRSSRPRVEGLEHRVHLHAGELFEIASGTGLTAQYYNNKDFTSLKLSRTDTTVNFNWASKSPSSTIGADTFSARWTGQVMPHVSETYTFYTSTDDGVRLWINGNLVIDKFVNQAQTEFASSPVTLNMGEPVTIRMDYFENTGLAAAKLSWSSLTTAKAVIPQDHLFPVVTQTPLPPPPPPPASPPPPPPVVLPTGDGVVRIDAGSASSFVDSGANSWLSDRNYSSGSASTSPFAVNNTTDDSLYYTTRFGKSFSYAIPLAPGNYTVSLLFADNSYNAGGRKFNVAAEGAVMLSNFDIVASAGGKGLGVTKSFDMSVTDGALNLAFTSVLNNATLSAIAIAPAAPASLPVAPTDLVATGISGSQMKLSWKDNALNETGYKIERKDANGEWQQIATVGWNTTSYTDSSLTWLTQYSYRVRANNSLGDSEYSNEITGRTLVPTITWKTVAASPVSRAEALGTMVNGKLYVLGGFAIVGTEIVAQTRCDVYDSATDTWTRIADEPEGITHAGIAVDGDTIWLVGNYMGQHPGPATSKVFKYNTTTDTWSSGPDLPAPRGAGAAVIYNRELHFFGGLEETRTEEEGNHWTLNLDDPDATWIEKASLANPRNHTSAAVIDGKIYCIGGQHGQELAQVSQADVDCYDPITDTWTAVAPLPAPRSHTNASTFAMNGKIIVLGGEIGYGLQQNTIYAYDPSLNTWSLLGTLPANRSTSVAGVVSGNKIITSTGNGPNPTAATWIATLS